MIKTGLEPLLAELNVELGKQFLYHLPIEFKLRPDHILAAFTTASRQNPIRQSIARFSRYIQFGSPREVNAIATNPTFQSTPLMASAPEMINWVEEEPILDFAAVIRPMLQSPDRQRAKGLSDQPRSLAVTVSEGSTARAVVYGNSYFASDEAARRTQGEASPLSFDLIGVTIDWLRDRPSIAAAGVESKTYSQYRFPQPASIDTMRILFLPLGLAFLCVLGLGAGVWVIRRR